MKLVYDWRIILKKAWSIRLMLLSGVFSGLEVILPLLTDSMPRGVFAILAMTVSIAAMVFRVLHQKVVSK